MIVASCSECRARCRYVNGAWICPTHRDRGTVELVDMALGTTRTTDEKPGDPYDLPTGTYEPPGNSKLIFLAGAITHYWNENWDTPERRAYHAWRNQVRYALIEAGYITYAPHEALKGPWISRAQKINNLAIAESDVFLIMSPASIPSKGTDEEMKTALKHEIPIIYAPESRGIEQILESIEMALDMMPVHR
jgi:hypothetical protein